MSGLVHDVQKAFGERFELTAAELMSDYLADVSAALSLDSPNTRVPRESERNMREMERQVGVSRNDLRERLSQRDPCLLCRPQSSRRRVRLHHRTPHSCSGRKKAVPGPEGAKERAGGTQSFQPAGEWRRRRASIHRRLVRTYGYCEVCANDLVEYVVFLLKGNAAFRVTHNDIEWRWP